MKLDPVSLKLFVTACETGTIACTAQREHIAPAAVSRRIAELEATFQTKLLKRNNKGVAPTAAGENLANLARRALHELDDVYQQMHAFGTGMRGHVRIFANISAITQFLPAELKSFVTAFPGVKLQLEEKISADVMRGVHENAADIGIYTHMPHGLDLHTLPYQTDELVLIAPASHPLAMRTRVDFADTLGFDYVGLHTGSAINHVMLDTAQAAGKPLKIAIQVTSFDAVCLMVRAGLGLGILPRTLAAGQRNTGLRIVRLADAWAQRELRICIRSRDTLPLAARFLVDHLSARHAAQPEPVLL